MAFNSFTTMFNRQPSEMNFGNGFNMKPKRNPFRALSFEQEPVEPQSFAQNYPRPQQKSAYEQFLENDAPRREDYDRSKGAKIAAALLSGIGGYIGDQGAVERNQNALDRPFDRAREDYAYEGGRLKEQFGAESARINQDRLAQKAIQDYELAKADDDRAERTLKNTIRGTDNTIRNTDNTIRNTGAQNVMDRNTGRMTRVLPNANESIDLGSFGPSYGQERTDRITDESTRNARELEEQKMLQSRASGLSYGNSLKLRKWDLDNPSSSAGIVPPNQQRDAEEMADQELLFGPQSKYKDLVEEVPNPTSANPNATGLKLRDLNSLGVVEGQILQNLLREYEREKAIKIDEILNKSRRGRFEITPIK